MISTALNYPITQQNDLEQVINNVCLYSDQILKLISSSGSRQGWWADDLSWQRIYSRCVPSSNGSISGSISMLYAASLEDRILCSVKLFSDPPPGNSQHTISIYKASLGWLSLEPFPNDSKLTSLPTLIAEQPNLEVVRYRPGKRCTFRTDDKKYFVKVFANDKGKKVHSQSINLWNAWLKNRLQYSVAKPIDWNCKTRALWQQAIEGESITAELFGPNAATVATQMGQACASTAKSTINPDLIFDYTCQMQRTKRYIQNINACFPEFISITQPLEQLLQTKKSIADQVQLKPIHGAPHMHQWLRTPDGNLGLVDFDRFSVGAPELDVATFIAEMDYENQTVIPKEKINSSFIGGYKTVIEDLSPDVVQIYRAHKHIAKTSKCAMALRTDNKKRTIDRLQRAKKILQEIS